MSIAFCYPGQGVQHVGMAEGFARSDRYFADMIATASEAAGIDMDKLLYEPNEDINITEFTQPALVTACCMITDALLDAGYKPAVTAGLSLGEVKKGRFEPGHGLALWLGNRGPAVNFTADSQEVKAYMHGETVAADHKGWCVFCVDGFGLGWAKGDGKILKNHYPKGLRRLN